ncbi:MAG: CHAT domain-containing protein [Leptolyngbyaceae cyanobacterium MO_188.B28]|nr:CHAT domain-containing protein [Leptolyngbyaceae cyanobacterium MO_188.B28]
MVGTSSVRKILLLAANPMGTSRLRLDEEVREIDAGLRRSQHRDQFDLAQRWAVRPRDIQRAMLDVNPQIVHFSGHGGGPESLAQGRDGVRDLGQFSEEETPEEGLVFEDEAGQAKLVSGAALAGLFQLFAEQVECVVLNGCYSKAQGTAIAEYIPYVIGMNQAIGDEAAIAFSIGFYDALGAGRDVEFAFKLGCTAIQLEGIAEHLTPELLQRSTANPKSAGTSGQSSQSYVQSPPSQESNPIQKRLALFQTLLSLPGPQFEQLVFSLNVPRGNLGGASAAQGERAPKLLEWVESPIGCGLETLEQVLNSIIHPQ